MNFLFGGKDPKPNPLEFLKNKFLAFEKEIDKGQSIYLYTTHYNELIEKIKKFKTDVCKMKYDRQAKDILWNYINTVEYKVYITAKNNYDEYSLRKAGNAKQHKDYPKTQAGNTKELTRNVRQQGGNTGQLKGNPSEQGPSTGQYRSHSTEKTRSTGQQGGSGNEQRKNAGQQKRNPIQQGPNTTQYNSSYSTEQTGNTELQRGYGNEQKEIAGQWKGNPTQQGSSTAQYNSSYSTEQTGQQRGRGNEQKQIAGQWKGNPTQQGSITAQYNSSYSTEQIRNTGQQRGDGEEQRENAGQLKGNPRQQGTSTTQYNSSYSTEQTGNTGQERGYGSDLIKNARQVKENPPQQGINTVQQQIVNLGEQEGQVKYQGTKIVKCELSVGQQIENLEKQGGNQYENLKQNFESTTVTEASNDPQKYRRNSQDYLLKYNTEKKLEPPKTHNTDQFSLGFTKNDGSENLQSSEAPTSDIYKKHGTSTVVQQTSTTYNNNQQQGNSTLNSQNVHSGNSGCFAKLPPNSDAFNPVVDNTYQRKSQSEQTTSHESKSGRRKVVTSLSGFKEKKINLKTPPVLLDFGDEIDIPPQNKPVSDSSQIIDQAIRSPINQTESNSSNKLSIQEDEATCNVQQKNDFKGRNMVQSQQKASNEELNTQTQTKFAGINQANASINLGSNNEEYSQGNLNLKNDGKMNAEDNQGAMSPLPECSSVEKMDVDPPETDDENNISNEGERNDEQRKESKSNLQTTKKELDSVETEDNPTELETNDQKILKKIIKAMRYAKTFEEGVNQFSGSKSGIEYYTLDENLNRIIDFLDKIPCRHNNVLLAEKITVIEFVNSLCQTLDKNVIE